MTNQFSQLFFMKTCIIQNFLMKIRLCLFNKELKKETPIFLIFIKNFIFKFVFLILLNNPFSSGH